ncbi:hypothetical protein [Paenibacillus puerhi]|uniref:hypothetical protein n=1 Tax=Paenibacillus puerhi TaxID=2692622 RepID=UPI00135AE7DD|nr:hypothetical protein [Paenibacillus puerhi]
MSTNRMHSHLDEIAWIGKLADLQDHQYRCTLLLTAMLELMQEKGLLSMQEIADKARLLEQLDAAEWSHSDTSASASAPTPTSTPTTTTTTTAKPT